MKSGTNLGGELMKTHLCSWLWTMLVLAGTARTADAVEPPPGLDPCHVAWYTAPATQFAEALPLGNGRLGATVHGGIAPDLIVLNEESMWSGSPFDDNRADAHRNLARIRQLLLEDKNPEAEQLVNQAFTCQGAGSGTGSGANVPFGCYQTAGQLRLTFAAGAGEPAGFRRWLDLRTGVAEVEYRQGDVHYHRQYFTSAPDQVCVIRLTASQPGSINLRVELARSERCEIAAVGNDQLLMTGQLNDGQQGTGGVRYAVRVRAPLVGGQVNIGDQAQKSGARQPGARQPGAHAPGSPVTVGGRVSGADTCIEIRQADEVVLLTDVETDYRGSVPRERVIDDPVAATDEVLERAAASAFEQLLARHVADHRSYYDRVQLTLGDGIGEPAVSAPGFPAHGSGLSTSNTPSSNTSSSSSRRAVLPTDQRLAQLRQGGNDPSLAALYFHYGRYLLIGSSRPGTLPANLQGIWAEEIQTPWNGDWHLDINVQMNYWPAEVCNLSDCHGPMLKLIESLQRPAERRPRRTMRQTAGWPTSSPTAGDSPRRANLPAGDRPSAARPGCANICGSTMPIRGISTTCGGPTR